MNVYLHCCLKLKPIGGLLSDGFICVIAVTLSVVMLYSSTAAQNLEPSLVSPRPVDGTQPVEQVPDDRAETLVDGGGSVDFLQRNPPIVLKVEAIAGQPLGIGRVKFRLRPGDELIDRTGATLLTDSASRILYPVITKSAVKQFIENFTGSRLGYPDDVHTIWFLFRGEAPLQLTLHGSGALPVTVNVTYAKRARQFNRFVRQWWEAFNSATRDQVKAGDYPPVFEVYLKSMVGRRMGMALNAERQRKKDPLTATFELMFDVEGLRAENIESAMLNGVAPGVASEPIPQPIQWTPVLINNLPDELPVEPIARYVPQECFYLRFGTWDNQLWLQRLTEEFGGDLGRMIQLRGFQYKIQSKFLDQLAIESSEFDRLFAGNLIDDVAVAGMDTYFNDGSAVGVLLYASKTKQLENNIRSKRKKFAEAHQDQQATLRTIDVDGTPVEFLSTPDNRYRSFYVVSGNCHLTTTSLTMATRFLEAAKGKGSLADSAEFKFARYNMPLDRSDTIFVYASTHFLQNLLTPQYQIELRRRNQVVTDIMMLEMASLAAAGEGVDHADVATLVDRGFLPQGFGSRPDAGRVDAIGETWFDSVRGRRGFFVPIPDLPIAQVSREEAAWYDERAQFFTSSIKSLDPMLIAIKRYQHEDKANVERVVFDGRLAPFGEAKYGWLMAMLGQPLQHEIAHSPEDIISLQANMKGGALLGGNGVRANRGPLPYQLFAAVQDYLDPNIDLQPNSIVRLLQTLREVPGYLGASPTPGYLDFIPRLGGEPDASGYTYSRLLKLWRLQWGDFSVLSFDRERLERLKPHLTVVPSERPAQIRLEVGDLAASNLKAWANSVNYRRSWQTSIANVKLLNMLTQQFRVDPGAALTIVERMLDVTLVCSLDGQYELAQLDSGRQIWRSTAWPSFARPQLPDQHVAPFLKWFRGLEVQVSKADTQFSIHGVLDIERSETKGGLPSFDMFKGFGNLFGG
jgi:hypothetical protein